jgi:hypothetical protein
MYVCVCVCVCVYEVIINDVSDYINLLVRIAHIICNHTYIVLKKRAVIAQSV